MILVLDLSWINSRGFDARRLFFCVGVDGVLSEHFNLGLRVGRDELRLRSWLRVHENKRKLGRQFTSEGAEEKLDFDGVGDDDSEGVTLIR